MFNQVYPFLTKFTNAIIAVILIPLIIKVSGSQLWMQIATLQTLGVIFSPLIQLHWMKFGGLTLIDTNNKNQKNTIWQSIITRLIAFVLICSTGSILVMKYYNEKDSFLLFGSFCYTCSLALSNDWFYLAKGDFKSLFYKESLPRFLLAICPIYFIRDTNELSIFFYALVALNILTLFIILNMNIAQRDVALQKKYMLNAKIRYTILQFINYSILFSPVPLVTYFKISNAFQFILMERFFRLFMTALLPISQIAHTQFLNTRSSLEISRKWAKITTLMQIIIIFVYMPTLIIFASLTNSSQSLITNPYLIVFFGILIVVTFTNRITEEKFVLLLRNIQYVNKMQSLNLLFLFLLLPACILVGRSLSFVIALIVAELFRSLYMRRKLKEIFLFE